MTDIEEELLNDEGDEDRSEAGGSENEFGSAEFGDEEGIPLLQEGETAYTFCYQHARSVPEFITDGAATLRQLDLSHNSLQNLFELQRFRRLEHLVLDNNELNDETKFPRLPNLQTLQVNHNKIANLAPLIRRLSLAFPKLTCLSLMGNPACPGGSALTGLLKEEDRRDHELYRCYIASRIKSLVFLDWQPLAPVERAKGFSIYRWSDFIPGASNNDTFNRNAESLVRVESGVGGEDDGGKTSRASKNTRRYVGNRSEGNRFIRNEDL